MTIDHTKLRSVSLSVLLLVIGALSLILHFEIYHRTSASAFINQPVFYYNHFYIRQSDGRIRDVSVRTGFWSYITAAFSVGSVCWCLARIVIGKKRSVAIRDA
jgi:hypothetical protein